MTLELEFVGQKWDLTECNKQLRSLDTIQIHENMKSLKYTEYVTKSSFDNISSKST